MIVSTKGRYALRVMVCLAGREDGEYVPLKEIAENEGISQKYLESIMTTLSKGDLVDAIHGKGGGYRLNRPAEKYTGQYPEADGRLAECGLLHCPGRGCLFPFHLLQHPAYVGAAGQADR